MPVERHVVKYRVRKNDTVMVIKGRERGKTGKVLRVIPERGRVVVERLNMVKRHSKQRGPQSPSGIVEKEAALQIANVMIFCDRCNAPVRIGIKAEEDGTGARICRRCGERLGND
ncbi:MAG TPA: 50S ribosomal protein L24 [Candidatus Binataceae bacterium]|nr:50S ribosomal protein L24 [Candidatus Binataceae bacterium]